MTNNKERRVPKKRSVEVAHGLAAGEYTTGHCPVCQQKMIVSSLKQNGDRPVYVCLAHRICLPLSKD